MAEDRNRSAERAPARDTRHWQRMREVLAQVEQERDDAIVYLSAIKRVHDVIARGQDPRQSAQEIAEILLHELGIETCAIALRAATGGELSLMGFATQAQRLGGPADDLGESGWLTLAQLVRPGTEPVCFRRTPDGGFGAVSAAELAGEGFVVLPFAVGDVPGGVLVLHALVAPVQAFGRTRALLLLAEITGQALGAARSRESIERLCGDLEGELGVTRRALSAEQERRRTHEENIAALTQALIRSNRVKREFLGTVSHELRTPLNNILGYASLVREGVAGAIGADQATLLDRVLTNSRTLNHLVDDMLFVVQLEADRVVVQRERVPAAELVGDVVASISAAAERPEVALHVDIAPEIGGLRMDPPLFRRILFHLVQNAFKFTTRGEVRIALEAGTEPGVLALSVCDTGEGIPADRIHEVFELFAQGDGSTTRRHGGLGMGLTLVQRCVRLLGGDVSMESQPGFGTEFRVRLPDTLAAYADTAAAPRLRVVH